MDAQQLDAIIRVSAVTLLLLLAVLLIRDERGRRIAASFVPLAVCLSGFLIGNTPDPSLRLHGFAGAVAHLLSGYAAVFMWWFCLASFDQYFRPKGAVLAVGVAWFLIASADRGLLGPEIADKGLSWLLIAIGFGMVVHLAWRLIRDRDGDLAEGRRKVRVTVAALLAAQLFVSLSKDVIFGFDWRPRDFTMAQNAAILGFILWLLVLLLRASTAPLTFKGSVAVEILAAKEDRATKDIDDEAGLAERLRKLVEVERVHLDPEMTFDAFVRKMGAPERTVRQLINHRLGFDHFRSFLNTHRMAEARRLLADASRGGDKLISIALDSGFASPASFNRAFRAFEGCSPSEYRNAQCAAGGQKPSLSTLNPVSEERSAGF